MKHELPLSYRLIHGTVGKEIVIKHYCYGVVTAKYPDMSNIKPTGKQKLCRETFKQATAYARSIIDDPVQKATWVQRLRGCKSVYNAAIKEYMLGKKMEIERRELETLRLLRKVATSAKIKVLKVQRISLQKQFQSPINKQSCQTIKNTQGSRIASG